MCAYVAVITVLQIRYRCIPFPLHALKLFRQILGHVINQIIRKLIPIPPFLSSCIAYNNSHHLMAVMVNVGFVKNHLFLASLAWTLCSTQHRKHTGKYTASRNGKNPKKQKCIC